MATKLQRAAHARTYDAEVRKSQGTGSGGQRLGGAKSHRSTPPQQDTEFAEILRQQSNTPPVHAKILPWVSGIETEGYQPPEGMFGPYDSQPPTRVQSIHELPPAPAQRSVHPFAYNAALPFSALAGESTENLADAPRPESEVMSRGAGLRYFTRPKDATPGAGLVGGGGQETPMTDISPDMGTFGIQPSQENLPLPSVLTKAMPTRKPVPPMAAPPAGPLPSIPHAPPKEPAENPPTDDPPHPFVNIPIGQHVHHSHPEYPFDPIEAARKQEEAMRQARAEALATLESIQKHPSPAGQAKGPRGTMETMTSDPSFGHLFHKDGVPMSRHMSLQDNPPMPIPVPPPVQPAGKQSMFSGGFYRIPFGVPMSVHLPRPLLVSRDSAGLGVGVGLPSRLAEIFTPNALSRVAESPESRQRKDDRSAYVETVQDEQEPVDPTVSARQARSGAPSRSGQESAALPESGIQPQAEQETTRQATLIDAGRPQSRASAGQAPPPPPKSPSVDPPFRQSTGAALPVPEVPAQTSHMATQGSVTPGILRSPQRQEQHLTAQARALGTAFNSHPETRNVSLSSQMPTVGTASPAPVQQELDDDHSTIAPTTEGHVKDIVNQSRFHDETLCQLLDAARLNLVGSEAKKALDRAAKERVAELRALRDRGELADEVIIPAPGKKSRERKSKDSKGKRSKKRSSAGHEPEESEAPTSPPQWAQEIIQRLAAFDTRYAELEKQANDDAPSQDFAGDLIDDLLFNELNLSGIPGGIPGMSSMPIHLQAALGFPGGFGPQSHSGTVTPRGGARISTLSPDKAGANGELISWGSEVELPPPEERLTPPKTPIAPIINIQAPTESNLEKSQRGLTATQGTRTPKANTIVSPNAPDIDTAEAMPMSHGHPVALPDPSERNLPATPAESIRSHRASPVVPHKVPLPPSIPSTGHVASPTIPPTGQEFPPMPIISPTIPPPQSSHISHHSLPPGVQPPMTFPFRMSQPGMPTIPPPQTFDGTAHTHNGTDIDHSQTVYKTAYEAPKTPERSVRDRIHLNDPLAHGEDPTPWDLVTQRLYSWALVWDEKSFVTALEEISLGRQVDEFALSIFVMMTFKRMLRRNMSESPVRACDKLFVPPTMANAINHAVHSKNFKAGQQMLEELWYPFLFKDPPRIIIALARHRNEPDQWTAHRYDLSTGTLRSYAITHEDKQLKDGRPFMWWHAIRLAWPQYNIPDPATLSQRLEKVHTLAENKDDNSLEALNYARNMFVGYRPERSTDLTKLRENVWGEVKRLLQKKRSGHLVVDLDSPTHVDDL